MLAVLTVVIVGRPVSELKIGVMQDVVMLTLVLVSASIVIVGVLFQCVAVVIVFFACICAF